MRDLRDLLFTYRSYTPLPFLALGLIFGAPTPLTLLGGFAIALLGEAIRFWGVGHATSETRVTGSVGASRLVVTGPFAHVRNPLYLGNILLYTGFGWMSNLPWLVALSLVWFLFQYAMIVSREEEFLEGRFGEEYARYRNAVHRFLPRIRPYETSSSDSIRWDIALSSERRTFQAFVIATLLMVGRFALLTYGGL